MSRKEENKETLRIAAERVIEVGTPERVEVNNLGTIATILTDMSISWAVAADSLEDIADNLKKNRKGRQLFCVNCGITETEPDFMQKYCRYCGSAFKTEDVAKMNKDMIEEAKSGKEKL